MKDRQKFIEIKLKNGVNIFYYPQKSLFNVMRVQVPVGSAHNSTSDTYGMAHFLEHILAQRSKKYKKRCGFDIFVNSNGGYSNAFTYYRRTEFELEMPAKKFLESVEGLFSSIFEPQFNSDDIKKEVGVISNERKQNYWFPSNSEVGKYMYTERMLFNPCPIRQVYGSDKDLSAITPESLKKFHKYYFSPGIQVLVGGDTDIGKISKLFSILKLKEQNSKEKYMPISWINKNYHEKSFKEINDYTLYTEYIQGEQMPYPEKTAVDFVGRFLTDSPTGILYKWLRQDMGWAYGTRFSYSDSKSDFTWSINIPLHNKNQLRQTKEEMFKKIKNSLRNNGLIIKEVERRLGQFVFSYQTLSDILDAAATDLASHNYIVTEKEYRNQVKACQDPKFLNYVFEKYFSQDVVGQFAAVPKK